MRTNTIFSALVATTFALTAFWSCKDDEAAMSGNAPTLQYRNESLVVDPNSTSIMPIVCIVNSDVGLRSVSTYIIHEGEVVKELDQPITNFYDKHHCSVSKTPVYEEDMIGFRVVAEDLAGQKTECDMSLTVIPVIPPPELYFMDGDDNVIRTVNHIQGDLMKDIFICVSSEEDLKTLTIEKVKASGTAQIYVVDFGAGVKSHRFNLATDGDGYEFESDVFAIKAKITAGARERLREGTMGVKFIDAMKIFLDQPNEVFNGLANNQSGIPFSGQIGFTVPVETLTYEMFDRNGQSLGAAQSITPTPYVADTVKFNATFTADPTLGSILVKAVSTGGHVSTYTIETHVGYKYLHLLCSSGGAGRANHANNPVGCFISAEKGAVYTYEEAMPAPIGLGAYEWIEIGIAYYSQIRLGVSDITKSITKFYSNKYNPVYHADTPTVDWPYARSTDVYKALITYANFMQTTGVQLAAETGTGNAGANNGIYFVDAHLTPGSETALNVVYYRFAHTVSGDLKKVILAYDKLDRSNATTPSFSTVWLHLKVEL